MIFKKLVLWFVVIFCLSSSISAYDVSVANLTEYYNFDFNYEDNVTASSLLDLSEMGTGQMIKANSDGCKLSGCVRVTTSGGLRSNAGNSGRATGNVANSMFGWINITSQIGSGSWYLFHQGNIDAYEQMIQLSYEYNGGSPKLNVAGGLAGSLNYGITLTVGQWYYVGWVYHTNQTIELWFNGVMVASGNRNALNLQFPVTGNTGRSCVNTYPQGGAYGNSNYDEVTYWQRDLSSSEILTLMNNSGNPYYTLIPHINVTPLFPSNNSVNNSAFANVSANYISHNASIGTCSLNVTYTPNGSTNYNYSVIIGTNIVSDTNISDVTHVGHYGSYTDGVFLWKFCCYTTGVNETCSNARNVSIDTLQPSIVNGNTAFVNGSYHWQNITLNFTISDPNLFEVEINVTYVSNNASVFNGSYNMSGTTVYNITTLINHSLSGWYTLSLTAWDGHTAFAIKDLNSSIVDKEIRFVNKIQSVKVYPVNKTDFESASTTKLADRNTFEFITKKLVNQPYQEFIVEGGDNIVVVTPSKYSGHVIVKQGSNPRDWYWVDFETAEKLPVKIFRENKNKIRVQVIGSGIKNYSFKSIGRLNVNQYNVTYYFDASNVVLAETYDLQILDGFPADYYVQATYNSLRYNTSLVVPSIIFNFNGTNYGGTLVSYNASVAYYNYSIVPSYSGFIGQVSHFWNFSINNQSNVTNYFNTNPTNQTIYDIQIGECNATLNNTIANLTYYDEYSLSPISADNSMVLTFYDGTYYLNYTIIGASAGYHALCTNLPKSEINYSWVMYGSFTISSTDYITRVYTFDISSGYTISNYYDTTIPFYLINLGNTSTVTYSWQTTNYQPITGLLKIYKCLPNGTKILVDSTPILTGVATSNIVLVYQQYSYELVIDGTTYTGDFTTCHVESTTTPTYYVNIYDSDISPVIGLLLIDCKLTLSSNNVTMLFKDIGGTSTLNGCLRISRQDIYGIVNVSNTCTTLTGSGTGQVVYSFLNDGNTYYAQGFVYQGNNTGFCRGVIQYPVIKSNTETTFGISAIFAVFLLMLGMILIYSDSGEKMMSAGVLAMIASWILGIFSIGWVTISLIIAFCLVIALIGRYAKKGSS